MTWIMKCIWKEHCIKTKEILTERNWPEEYIRTIISHGWGYVLM